MLVPGLENSSLFRVVSGHNIDCSYVHHSLYQCAREMLDKYKEKRMFSEKLGVKILAVQAMLGELGKLPKSSLATRETISAALKSHAAALQGHEHLLSEKGNNYALMEQTRSLRKHGDAPASLLRYHDLKNKVLVPDKTLSPENREAMRRAIYELSAKKGLTLGILEVIERKPCTSGLVLGKLYKADMLEQDLCTWVFKQKNLDIAASMLVILHQGNLSRVDARRMAFAQKNPLIAAKALVELNKADLLESEWCTRVLEHNSPHDAATALLKLKKADLLESEWCTRVLEHKSPDKAATAILELGEEGLLDSNLLVRLLKYTNPDEGAMDLIEVKKITEVRAGETSSENEKVELLYKVLVTIVNDKIRDFFIASQSDYSDNIETVTMERVMLTPSFAMYLVSSIDPVATFISRSALTVSVFPLSEMQKGELLCRLLASSNSADDDISGFHLALQNGHAKFIATFIRESAKAIAEFHLPEAQSAELLYRLFHGMERANTQDFLLALEQGGPEVNKAFTEGIDLLPISAEQKEALKHPTPG